MPVTEIQNSFLNRISIRRNQIAAVESNNNELDQEDLELFSRNVADRFTALLPAPESPSASPQILTLSWFRELLDAFLSCEAEFKALLLSSRDPSRPPLDRLVPDLLDRSVKALDVFNAVTNALDLMHHWQKLAQIAVSALHQSPVGEGQVRRARRALATLIASMSFDDKDGGSGGGGHGKWAERTRSFGRRLGGALASRERGAVGSLRSLSWTVAKSWSAAKQVQGMLMSLAAPRGGEAGGMATPVYIMNTMLVFAAWALVAAVPCQERHGLATNFHIPRSLSWAQPMMALQERIGEEVKRKEKKGNPGLMEELQKMEAAAHSLVEFADGFVFPLEDGRAEEMAKQVEELAGICQKMEEGLGPLQQLVREVFHRIVKSRGEILDVFDHVNKLSATVQY
ncbi:protein ROH1-like [Salvia splendens]|uniref:protein ROH1-like n=1 Tax=Salvia splendens TaxID=180675 RepID=UPI001C252D52|nr:protein ROH1-like [Salvia splendens]